ncbi:hypothetical protein [Novosphingobium sp. ES2-1]|uniref:hypothetical protein n=1 Tax=Novosphingobium sp. ES2-1 TaxID=2780074 RepID=UPI001882EF43|nr:hypothetical protein [Novosphingobium sp. ES2-1]QOV95268.1 hypothetical protein IM701_07580 [Novosphingobium sp. ES2-1]
MAFKILRAADLRHQAARRLKKKGRRKDVQPFVKGVVLVNCGEVGLDWERTSISMYLEAMSARDPEQPADKEVETGTLSRFLSAHSSE